MSWQPPIDEPARHHVHVVQALRQGSDKCSAITSGCLERETPLWCDCRLRLMIGLVRRLERFEPAEELEFLQELACDAGTLLLDELQRTQPRPQVLLEQRGGDPA